MAYVVTTQSVVTRAFVCLMTSPLTCSGRPLGTGQSGDRMDAQRTLRRQISCAGIGLHSGNKVTLTLKPAAADTGIRLPPHRPGRRDSRDGQASLGVSATPPCSGRDGATVETVEHLLAALVSAGIDNVVVELNHREVPIMDGSSAPFLYLIQEAGVKRLARPAQVSEDPAAGADRQRRQAHRDLPVGSLQGQLHDQLRPSAAAAPVAHRADHRAELRGEHRRRRAPSAS